MGTSKRRVAITFENHCDHLRLDDPRSLVEGIVAGPDGISEDGPQVRAFLEWLTDRSAESADAEYTCTPSEAKLILDRVARLRDG
jgi:hypothetical protein